MELEMRDLVKQNLELTRENNRLLKKMRRSAAYGAFFKILWLAIIIGVPVYVYLTFIAPTWEQVSGSARETSGQIAEIQELLQNKDLEGLIELFRNQ